MTSLQKKKINCLQQNKREKITTKIQRNVKKMKITIEIDEENNDDYNNKK